MLDVAKRIDEVLAVKANASGPWWAALRLRDRAPAEGAVPSVPRREPADSAEAVADAAQAVASKPGSAGADRRAPERTFRDFDQAPVMVPIPLGRFTMGAPAGEQGSGEDERPQHEVSFARAFALSRVPVTFAQWAAAQADNGVDHAPSDHGWGGGSRPVIDVSWDDAEKFTRWLTERSDRRYRLPTEAEWEYAARAGTTAAFWWGDTVTSEQANFDARYVYGGASPGEYRRRTVPVEEFQPNPWGLCQMHGNVWEWCQDRWSGNYLGAPCDGAARQDMDAPRGILAAIRGAARLRVVRGGSWKAVPKDLRSARRMSFPQDYRTNAIGFRVACDL
jgi:formylglycine-generating enzyme required for sulfatase activity